jgi:Protein of unknown function (DUF3592)
MFSYIRGSFFFWFGLLFAIVGTPFLVVAVYQLKIEREIIRDGVFANATLVEKGHSSSRNSSSNYWLKYVFNDPHGVEHIRQAQVKWEQWRQFKDGDTLAIRYLPENPDRNRLGGEIDDAWWVLPLVFGGLGVIFGGLGWTFVIVAIRKIMRQLSLLRTGSVVEADITSFEFDPTVRINGRNPPFFRYRYIVDGKKHTGRSPDLPFRMMGRWNHGDKVRVFYDARQPENSEADVYGIRGD